MITVLVCRTGQKNRRSHLVTKGLAGPSFRASLKTQEREISFGGLTEAFLGLALRQILIAARKAGICCRKILLSAALATTANFSRIRSASPRSTEWCCRQSRHYENTNSHSNCCLRHLYLCGVQPQIHLNQLVSIQLCQLSDDLLCTHSIFS